MKWLRSAACVATLLVSAAPASAQNFRFVTGNPYGNPTAFGARVGPYRGQLIAEPGSPIIDIFCVDYLHTVSVGQTWTAAFTPMYGDLSQTRLMTDRGLSQAGALYRYRMAAWLSTQFRMDNMGQWAGIHGTIWNIMAGSNVTGMSSTTYNYWRGQADLFASTINLDEWTIISDVNGRRQEFLTRTNVVPEPETVILLGSGLLMLGLVAYRRGGAI